MPRVSVIIPAFNAEAYIGEALSSVEAQTFEDWEVVIGDDCSTDGTAAIARGFGARIRIVANPQNAGPATARNLAIAQATGELLAFLDADDYWFPEFLEHQVGLFDTTQRRHGDVGIVACNARVLSASGFLPETYMDYVAFPSDVTLSRLLRSNPIFVSVVSPSAIIDEVGGFSTGMSGAADYDLWLRIVELDYRVVATRRPIAVYRVGPASLSADVSAMSRDVQRAYRRALERGKLTPHERRIARRELRLQRAIERVVSGRMLGTLPLLALVAAEHPNRWPSYARMLARRKPRFSAFGA
jgi:glycosyltransferase involved in cell wall biosynthesis